MRTENENEDIELITLVDDDHVEHTFEIIDALEYEGDSYYALLPVYDDEEDQQEDEGEYYIFQTVEEDGDEFLLEVEDDALLDKLAAEFEKRFDELFDGTEEE